MVVCDVEIVLTSHSLAAGGLSITGLPFSAAGNCYTMNFSRPEGITLSTSYDSISGYTSGTSIVLLQVRGTWDALLVSNITGTSRLRGSISYQCT